MTIHLTEDQDRAVSALHATRRGILCGNAGTGKTTSMEALSAKLQETGAPIYLTAPTHKAAGVLRKKTGRPVRTIHSVLKLVPRPNMEDGGKVLVQSGDPDVTETDVLIIDEASMLSPRIMELAERATPNLIYVGDDAQLPPVGHTSPFFLDAPGMAFHKLDTIMRQTGDNPIPVVAADWRPGGQARWPKEDLMGQNGGVQLRTRREAVARFLDEAVEHFTMDGSSDDVSPALCYTNRAADALGFEARSRIFGKAAYASPYLEGELCVCNSPVMIEDEIVLHVSTVVRIESVEYNEITVQGEDWPCYMIQFRPEGGTPLTALAMPYAARDAMLQQLRTKALAVTKMYGKGAKLSDEAWREFHTLENEVLDLRTVYASTIHKAQGSGYKNVYLDRQDMLNRNAEPILSPLVYTALTRAHEVAIIAG